MKKLIYEIFCGKNSLAGGFLALAVIGLIGLGCFCNKDKMGSVTTTETPKDSPTASPKDSPSPSPTKEIKKANASKYEIPSDDEMQDIAKKTLLDFNDALQKEDFTDFHRGISKYWAKQTSPEKLKTSFQGFIDGEADMSDIKSMKADFTSPLEIEREGSIRKLMAKGEYDTSPLKTEFELQYIPEGKEWKLFGIRVYTNVKRK